MGSKKVKNRPKPLSYSEVIPYNETKIYIEDRLGLKKLDSENKIHRFMSNNSHTAISEEEVEKFIIPFLGVDLILNFKSNNNRK